MSGDLTEFYGEPISVYLVADGVRDGIMVDATSDLTREAGYRIPVTFTRKAWDDLVTWTREPGWQDETGRLWDVLWMGKIAAKRAAEQPGERHRFALYRVPNTTPSGRPSTADRAAKVWAEAIVQAYDRHGTPCLTILLPGED